MSTPQSGATPGVIVLTSDQMLRELLHLLLEDRNYNVREASDDVEALELIEQSQHPLIVALDLCAEDFAAFDVLRAAARDPRLGFGHAYVLLSPPKQPLPCDIWPLVEALAIPVLCKPLDLDELLEVVGLLSACLRGSLTGADPLSL